MVLRRTHARERPPTDDAAEGAQEVGQDRNGVRFGVGLEDLHYVTRQSVKGRPVELGPRLVRGFGCLPFLPADSEHHPPAENLLQLRVKARRHLLHAWNAGGPPFCDSLLGGPECVRDFSLGALRQLPAYALPRGNEDGLCVREADLTTQQHAAQVREVLVASVVRARLNVLDVAGDGLSRLLSQLLREARALVGGTCSRPLVELRRQHKQRRPVGYAVHPGPSPTRRRHGVTAVALAVQALRHLPAPYLAVAGVAEVPVGAAPGPYRGLAVVGFHPCDGLRGVCIQDYDSRHDASGERYVVVLAAFHDPLCYLAEIRRSGVEATLHTRFFILHREDLVSDFRKVWRSPKDGLCGAAVRGTQAKTSSSTAKASNTARTSK